ncbi:MAG: universal stress protein [Haloarculaceae archaeon]
MYDRILVATDGSESAAAAVRRAIDLADQYDATLHAVFVVDTRLHGEPAFSSVELLVEEIEDRGHRLLGEIVDTAEDRGIDVVARCCHGVPHEEILAHADEVDADLLVLGYKGETHLTSEHIGSVAERVVRFATRPVLLS